MAAGTATSGRGGLLIATLAGAALISALFYFMPAPVLPLLLAAALVGLAFSLYLPLVPCVACVGVIGYRMHDAFPALNPLMLPLLTTLWMLLTLVIGAVTGRAAASLPRAFGWMLAFVAAIALSNAFAIDPARSWHQFSESYIKIITVVVGVALLIRTERDFDVINLSTIAFGAVLGFVAISNKLDGIGLVEETRVTIGRDLGSPLGDPNDLTLVLLLPLSFAIGMLRYGPRARRPLALLAIGLMLTAIIFTQSRGGLLGVMALLAVFGLRAVRSKVVLGVVVAVAAMGLYAVMGLGDRGQSISLDGGLDLSAQSRIDLWFIAIRTFLSQPLLGVGMENFALIAAIHTGVAFPTHNTPLQVLVETGLIGAAAFFGMLAVTARSLVHGIRFWDEAGGSSPLRVTCVSCAGALAAFLVASLFITHAYTWTIYWIVCLAAMAAAVTARQLLRALAAQPAPAT